MTPSVNKQVAWFFVELIFKNFLWQMDRDIEHESTTNNQFQRVEFLSTNIKEQIFQ